VAILLVEAPGSVVGVAAGESGGVERGGFERGGGGTESMRLPGAREISNSWSSSH